MKNYDCVAVFSTPLYLNNEVVYGTFFDTNQLRKKLKHPWYQEWDWTFSDIIDEYVSHLKRKHYNQNPDNEIDNFSHTVLFFEHPIIAEKDIYSGHLITNKNYIDNLQKMKDMSRKYDCVAVFSHPLHLEGETIYGTLFTLPKIQTRTQKPSYKMCNCKWYDLISNYIIYLKRSHDKLNPDNVIDGFSFHLNVYDQPLELQKGDNNEDWIINKDFIKNLPSS